MNGRYVKMSPEEMLFTLSFKDNKPLTKEEKRNKRDAYLREQALISKDPGLYDVFKFYNLAFHIMFST